MTACSDVEDSCDQFSRCNVRDPLRRIKDRIVTALTESSVADLRDEPAPAVMPVVFQTHDSTYR